MNKIELGRQRVERFEVIANEIKCQDFMVIEKLKISGIIKKDGTLSRKDLAKAIGLDCKPDTFRQNAKLKEKILALENFIKETYFSDAKVDVKAKSKQVIGDETEESFLAWLSTVGTEELPAPTNINDRLFKKALWAFYSEQPLEDVKAAPNWFNSREAVKAALDELDLKVVAEEVTIKKYASESIADDMENSMTSALVRKLRGEIKTLTEKLDSEREMRKEKELELKQYQMLSDQIPSGKMAH
jgi:hypothetical protein